MVSMLKCQCVNQNLWDLNKKIIQGLRLMSRSVPFNLQHSRLLPNTTPRFFWGSLGRLHLNTQRNNPPLVLSKTAFPFRGFIITLQPITVPFTPSSQTKHFPTPLLNKNAPSSQTNATPVCFFVSIIIPKCHLLMFRSLQLFQRLKLRSRLLVGVLTSIWRWMVWFDVIFVPRGKGTVFKSYM